MMLVVNVYKKPGFTLMELLITLTLFAIIMTFLMTSFFQFQDQNQRMESVVELRQESRILERIIREDLQNVLFLHEFMKRGTQDYDQRKSGIIGVSEAVGDRDNDSIHMHVGRLNRFYRTIPHDKDPAIHEVSYFLEETGQQTVQLRRREEFYIDSDITEGDESIVHTLSDNVRSFDVKYYIGVDPEEVEEWDSAENSKRGASALPAGVKVTIELENEKGEILKSAFQVNIKPDMGTMIKWK